MALARKRLALEVGAVVGVLAVLVSVSALVASRRPAAIPGSARIAGELVDEDDAEIRALRESLGELRGERLIELIRHDDGRVLALVVRGEDVAESWEALHTLVPRTGRWPVVIGGADDVELLLEMGDPEAPVAGVLARAAQIDAEAWLATRRAELDAEFPAPRGPWPTSDPLEPAETGLTLGADILSGVPHPEVAIALVPTRNSWEAPAWLSFGAYNDCPEPAVHVALLRRWHERFGAEVHGMSGSILETIVARPPTDRDAALVLAGEQYAYDYDIVTQGTGTVDALASTLHRGRTWFFWWD